MARDGDILVEVKGVSKKFSQTLKMSMMYGLRDLVSTVLGGRRDRSKLRKAEFWAVKQVSFELRRGECLALVGRNGAGKSTLLKMLNGLIAPDEGSITIRGKVGALIELGAGFNPLLSGRENIYINGQLLGFSKKEIDDKLESIIEFSEIRDFIDSPVQNYSSGMKVRLGFAVAAQMEPDVLIIDEVLAVGDLGFVLKCFNTIDNLLQNTAVIFVSHNMQQVSRICSDIMLMEHGKTIFYDSDVSKGIDIYYSEFSSRKKDNVQFARNDEAELIGITLGEKENGDDSKMCVVNHLDDLAVGIRLKIKAAYSRPSLTLTFFDKEQRPVGVCLNEEGIGEEHIYDRKDGFLYYKVSILLQRLNLSKGVYSISVTVSENFRKKPMLRIQSVCEFRVNSKHDVTPPVEFEGVWS